MTHLKIESPSGPPRAHPLLTQFLAENDTPCPGCGYNLRGLTTTTCPECRQEFDLRLQLAEPHTGTLIATIAPLIAVAGAAALVIIFVFVISIAEGDSPSPRWFLFLFVVPGLVFSVLGGAAIYLCSLKGRRWHRTTTNANRSSALRAAWIASTAAFVGYLVYAIRFLG